MDLKSLLGTLTVKKSMAEDKSKAISLKIPVSVLSDKEENTILTSFMNGVEVPKSTQFHLYQHKKRKLNDVVLHGENENLIYDGSLKSGQHSKNGYPKYCIGIYDPESRSLKLVKTKLIPTKIESKKLLKVKDNYEDMTDVSKLEQRSRLGEEFGTRRAKAALSSYKKNRVDASKLQENELDIASDIQKSTSNIPDKVKLTKTVEAENRLIPKYNEKAASVDEVYPVEGVISEREQGMIQVDVFLQQIKENTAAKTLLELMPYYTETSVYLLDKLEKQDADSSDSKLRLKIMYYISTLMGVYFNRRSRFMDKLLENFQNQPSTFIVDSCLKRFTDYNGIRKHFYMDPMNEDKILTYILTLMLRLDNYTLPITPLAQELSINPSRLVSLLRSLGCHTKNATIAQKEAWNVPKNAVYKVAVLTVPLKLPPMIRRGRKAQNNNH